MTYGLSSIDITSAGTYSINLNHPVGRYRIYTSTPFSLSSGQTVAITYTGIPLFGMEVEIIWEASITLASGSEIDFFFNSLEIKGDGTGNIPAIYGLTAMRIKLYFDGSQWKYTILPSFDQEGFISHDNQANEIVELSNMADLTRGSIIVGGLADRPTALDAKTSAQILVGDGTDLASVAMSGHATISSAGAVTLANDSVSNAILADMTRGTVKVGGAANVPTDLDAKTSGQILVGDGTDIASVPVTGVITLSSAGVTAFATNVIQYTSVTLTNAQIATLNSVPVTLIADPGAGKAIWVVDCVGELNYSTAAISGSGVLNIICNGADIAQFSTTGNQFLFGSVTKLVNFPKVDPGTAGQTQIVESEALTAQVTSADPTMGASASTITLHIAYIELTV